MAFARSSLAIASFLLTTSVVAQDLSDSQVWSVRQRMAEAAQLSWELGTRAQVIIEYDAPPFNVLSTACEFPFPADAGGTLDTPIQIASQVVSEKPNNIKPLFDDGSAADPASVGPSVLIANWTGENDHNYGEAASEQLDYLLNDAPRNEQGAISHRNDKVQLWSDFVYMVPPFLAMYGAMQHNTTILDEAFNQIELYRNALRSDNGLWKHIVGDPNGQDPGHWSTGNGWVAMGMLRVAGTYRAYSSDYNDKKDILFGWAEEIIDAMYTASDGSDTALFYNYVDQPDTFREAASTALVAAATYRLATLTDGRVVGRINDAERARHELSKNAGSGGAHIDSEGWLSPVVNPHNFPQEGEESAEGQAFVVSMQAGWRAWRDIGSPTSSASRNSAISRIVVPATLCAILSAFLV